MNDPLIARFAEVCGATDPLNLRVHLAEGGVLAEGIVQQPFTLVGRDDACDVTLSDPEVNPRHTWLQVLGGRVYAIDLGAAPDWSGRTGPPAPAGSTPVARCGSARSAWCSAPRRRARRLPTWTATRCCQTR